MPRSALFSKKEIVDKALEIIREQGLEALSARSLGKALNCSSSPIFTVFKNMEEVLSCTREAAEQKFNGYVADVTEYDPAFKEFGLRLIRFARKEPNTFNYLFLHPDAAAECVPPKARECLNGICESFGITQAQADTLFQQMWTFACGLSVLCSKDPDDYPEDKVSEMLSFAYASNISFLKSGKPVINIIPEKK